jgi:hypothetical protein
MPSTMPAGNVRPEPVAGARARAARTPSGRRGQLGEPRQGPEASGRLGLALILTAAFMVVLDCTCGILNVLPPR